MKRDVIKCIACAGLLLLSTAAIPAAGQYQDDDAWHRIREEYFARTDWRIHMFDRIRLDLDHVQETAFHRRDEDRIVETKAKIAELRDKMVAGRYDQPELDDVIASLDKVVSDNRLAPRDRNMLSDDLNRVRDYRAHHEDWR